MTISNEKWEKLRRELIENDINESDITEIFSHAGGPGGQKVNKTEVAVQLKYQDIYIKNAKTRSREDNRYFARKELLEQVKQAKGIKTKSILKIEKKIKQKKRRKKKSQGKYNQDTN